MKIKNGLKVFFREFHQQIRQALYNICLRPAIMAGFVATPIW
jgi:hypothetical protein